MSSGASPKKIKKIKIKQHSKSCKCHKCMVTKKIQAWWRGCSLRKKNLENKKIKKWLIERNKKRNKGNIDILPKDILLLRYKSFVDSVRKQILTECNLGSYIGRIPNFPECISENIVLYILRFLGVKCTWKCSGDILVGETNTQGEVKCHFNGPSQFSPKKKKTDKQYSILKHKNTFIMDTLNYIK